jgi:MFS superfamily sulfate permease-like transporter
LFDELEKREYDDSLILDLTSTESIAPDAAGLLVHLAQRCTRTGKELWITGAKPSLRSVLRATFPAGEPFRVATTLQDALHFVRSRSLHEARLEGLKSDAAQV